MPNRFFQTRDGAINIVYPYSEPALRCVFFPENGNPDHGFQGYLHALSGDRFGDPLGWTGIGERRYHDVVREVPLDEVRELISLGAIEEKWLEYQGT